MESNSEVRGTGKGGILHDAEVCVRRAGEDDVLFGRGKGAYNHEGNVRFRTLVVERAVSYRLTKNTASRRALAREVIKEVEARGGRFLRPKPSYGDSASSYRLESVPNPLVLTKVKQALRDMSAAMLQESKSKATAPSKTRSDSRAELVTHASLLDPILVNPFCEAPFVNGSPKVEQPNPQNHLSQLENGWLRLAALQQEQEETQRLLSYFGRQVALQSIQKQLSGLLPIVGQDLLTTPGQQHLLLQSNLVQEQQNYCMGLNSVSTSFSVPPSLSDSLALNGVVSVGPLSPVPSSSLLPSALHQLVPPAGHGLSLDQPSALQGLLHTTEKAETVSSDTSDDQTSISSPSPGELKGIQSDKYLM